MDTSLITFKAISNFTKDLGDIFSSNQHSLRLYSHLISKTTLAHDKAIKKHIDTFKDFCILNREAITSKDSTKFLCDSNSKVRIMYSKNVYIDINAVFAIADKDTQQAIWKHLLVISALVDPSGIAKKILKQTTEKESDFLADIISKVEQNVDVNSNPMEAVSNIMKSGVLTDIIAGMNDGIQNGSLDLGKLMGSVQNMVSTLNGQAGSDGSDANSMNALNTMMGNLTHGLNNKPSADGPSGETSTPDLSALMAMMGPMLSTLTNSSPNGGIGIPNISNLMNEKSIGDIIEDQVQVNKGKKSKSKKSSKIEDIDE